MIVNQESFCRHWCSSDYDEVIKEQSEECESIVACSSSENGMNPDVYAAQGLMMKCEEDLFEEALVNFAKIIIKARNMRVKCNSESGGRRKVTSF